MYRLLFLDLNADDAAAAVALLRRGGLDVDARIVTTHEAFASALEFERWDAIMSEDALGGWTGLDALAMVRAHDADVTFILYAHEISEERAIAIMKAGANDYIFKDRNVRLLPAIEREVRDVATRIERRHLFEQLRKSQERFRCTFEKAPIGIANMNADGVLLSVNERLCEIAGYAPHEMIGRQVSDFAHPEDRKLGEDGRSLLIDAHRTTSYQRRYFRKDGALVWTSVTLTPVLGEDGKLAHIIGLVEDITEQKQAEVRLALQSRLLDSVDQAVIAFDLDGTLLYWNRFAEVLYGWAADDVQGRDISAVLKPVEGTLHYAEMLDMVRGGEGWAGEATLTRRDGTTFTASLSHTPLVGIHGEISGVVSVSRDITKEKEAAEELLRHKEQLAEAQELAKIGSWEYDLITGRRVWSEQMSRIYGLEPGHHLPPGGAASLAHPDDQERLNAMHQRAVATLEPFETDHRIVLPDGSIRVLYVRSRWVRDASGKPVKSIGISQDITHAKHIENELRRRTLQQSAIANLGQVALRRAPLTNLFAQACATIAEVMELQHSEIVMSRDNHCVRVGSCGWSEPTTAAADRASQVAFALAAGTPADIQDLARETRFTPSPQLIEDGLKCGLVVPIAIGSEPWGMLAVYSRGEQTFTTNEVVFLSSIATILGQAIESARAERELRVRAVQQSAIAELGRLAAESIDERTIARACELLRDGLSISETSYHTDAANADPALRGQIEMAIAEREPVVFASEENGIAMPVMTGERVHGVLVALSAEARQFSAGDVQFAQSLANTLAEAMERDRATDAMAESEERYRSVVEGASEIIFAISADGRFTALNRAFETVTGWTREEWIGRSFIELVESDSRDRVTQFFGDLLAGSTQPVQNEPQIVCANGNLVRLDVTTFPKIENGAVVAVYGFARDVTEERRAEAERRKLETKLEQAHRLTSLGRLAATVAHEFNNVLMGISPFVEVIRRTTAEPRCASALDQISRSIRRGKRITEDILRFTRPADPVRAAIDISQWLRSVATEARSLMSPTCAVDLHVNAPQIWIDGDVHQLHQTITNLIFNARDAMPNGGMLTISARREAKDAHFGFGVINDPDRYVHITVTDSGVGINSEMMRHIFEPLFTTKKNGTGLGLAVAHQVVQRHGGEIFVESRPGIGTSFHLFLPLSQKHGAENGEPTPEPMQIAPSGHRVLLVEDDPAVASGIISLLELEGLRVELATTGAEAIRAARHLRPDVIVLDVGLPDMEGTSAFEAIRKQDPQVPVIFSTGHADRTNLDSYLATPNTGYLLKPYEASALLAAIHDVTAMERVA